MNDEFGPDHFYSSDHHGTGVTQSVSYSLTPRTCVFNDHRGGPFYFFLSEKRTWEIQVSVAQGRLTNSHLLDLQMCWDYNMVCEPLLQWCQFFSLLIVHNLVPHFA